MLKKVWDVNAKDISNEQTAHCFGRIEGSSQTIPRRNTKKLDRDVNAFERVLGKLRVTKK